MRYAQIREMDISNGEGIGVALFVQGCPFHCDECFNPETWDFNGGTEWDVKARQEFIKLVNNPHIKRVSILGGEPLSNQNCGEVACLINYIKYRYPEKAIWLYTGYTYEHLRHEYAEQNDYPSFCKSIAVESATVLVDGQFEKDKKDLSLKFRGSSNQRVIDIKQMRELDDFENIIIKKGYEYKVSE